MVRPLRLAAALLLVLLPGLAAQAEDPVEATYLAYHRAIRAGVYCANDGKEFDQPQQARLAGVIDQKVDFKIGTGRRLTLIEQAKSEMRDLHAKHGCTGEPMRPHLDLYRAELEPALP